MELISRFEPYIELLKKGISSQKSKDSDLKENLEYYSIVAKILKYIYDEKNIKGFGNISIDKDVISITTNGKKETIRITKTNNFQWSFISSDILKFSNINYDDNIKLYFNLRKNCWINMTKNKFNNDSIINTTKLLLEYWFNYFKTIEDSTLIWLNILNEKTNYLILEKSNGYKILNITNFIIKQSFEIYLMENSIIFIFEKGSMLRFSIDIEKGIKPNIGYIFDLCSIDMLEPIAIIPK